MAFSSGFLPEIPPLSRLPQEYEQWESILDYLPRLIQEKNLRNKVNSLPILPVSDATLPTEQHWQRAYCVLSFLSQGYLWERGEKGTVTTLPKQLAVPWWEVSARCGLPPVGTYTSTVLWNWSLKDSKSSITFENSRCPLTFTGTRDEEWFYLIPLGIEMAATPGINAAKKCFAGIEENNAEAITESLKEVLQCIANMLLILNKMDEECDPVVFYRDIRPFQGGSKNLLAFSEGLIYEGVDEKPKAFSGASAAQSATLPVFDILLGVQHDGEEKIFLEEQRWHMPRPHRQFLLSMTFQPPLREYVQQHKNNEELVSAYNACIKELANFRNRHIILVTRYILNQAAQQEGEDKKEGSLATRGTGGSPLLKFLKAVRDNTLKCSI